ncbi:MAG: hypothetical protein FWH24_04660 [Oscillospiraceae bacterium]|nr:hypothetical protein [Oscillospiraceae bacterium]
MLKQITAITLIFFALFAFLACGEAETGGAAADTAFEDDSGSQADSNENAAEENTEDKSERPASVLPAEMDFGNREFRIVMRTVEQLYHQFITEEVNGEPINDSLMDRNSRIEEKYNVKFIQSEVSDPSSVISRNVRAGDYSYDLMIDTIRNGANLGAQSMLLDLHQVPYISEAMSLSRPWWDSSLERDLAINNTLFFQAGDLIMHDKLRLAVIYFNKDMFQTLGLDFPYEYVYNGTWTMDKLQELTRGVNQDLNGDGVMNQHDQWGFMSQHEASFHFYAAAGLRTVTLDSEGVPEITMNTAPRALEVIQRALEITTDGVTMFHADKITGADNVWLQASAYFQENRFALRSSVFEPVVRDLRAMPTDFGLLPYVKFDERQEDYYSWVEMSGWVVGIPNNADPDFTGFITEALAYESGDTLMPAFYDLCLYSRILRDNDSEDMLDIIFNGRVYDIGYIFGIGELSSVLASLTSAGNTDFVSRFERIEPAAQSALEKFIETYNVD